MKVLFSVFYFIFWYMSFVVNVELWNKKFSLTSLFVEFTLKIIYARISRYPYTKCNSI